MRLLIKALKKAELLSAVSCRLTYWTGKSKVPVHPKHLIANSDSRYLNYFNKGDMVLDLGCHQGEISFDLAKKAGKIVAVDHDKKLLERALFEKKRRKINNVTFLDADLEKRLPFKDNQFDLVIFLDVLEHLNNRDQALREINRVIKKKGRLILAVPNRETSWKRKKQQTGLFFYSDPDHKIEFTRSEIEAFCRKHNFQIDAIIPNAYDTWLNPFIDLTGGVSLTLYKKLRDWKKSMLDKYPEEGGGFFIIAIKN